MQRLGVAKVPGPAGFVLPIIGVHRGGGVLTTSDGMGAVSPLPGVQVVHGALVQAFQACDPQLLDRSLDLTSGTQNLGRLAMQSARSSSFTTAQRAVVDIISKSFARKDLMIDMRSNDSNRAVVSVSSNKEADFDGEVHIFIVSNRPSHGEHNSFLP